MEFQMDGVPPAGRGPGLRDALQQFPGPIAIAHEDISATLAIGWRCHGTDDETYAVSVTYDSPGLHRLAVKTARPLPGRARHVPLENPLVQIVNYLDRADIIAHPERYRSDPDRPAPIEGPGSRYARSHNFTVPESSVSSTSVTIALDDTPVTARRLDIEGCAVIELPWGEHTVFCTGTPADIDTLRLRTATPDDFHTRRV